MRPSGTCSRTPVWPPEPVVAGTGCERGGGFAPSPSKAPGTGRISRIRLASAHDRIVERAEEIGAVARRDGRGPQVISPLARK